MQCTFGPLAVTLVLDVKLVTELQLRNGTQSLVFYPLSGNTLKGHCATCLRQIHLYKSF